jgi:hypothetical protein
MSDGAVSMGDLASITAGDDGGGEPEIEDTEAEVTEPEPKPRPVPKSKAEPEEEPEGDHGEPAEPAKAKAPPPADDDIGSRKVKVKIDGEEREITVAEMQDAYETKQASYKRFEQAAQERKRFEAIRAELKANPRGVVAKLLQEHEHDPQQFYIEAVHQMMQEEKMSPEERKRAQLRAELQELEQRKQQMAWEEQQRRRQAMQARFQTETMPAWQAAYQAAGVPWNEYTYRQAIHEADKALARGIELSPQELAERVRGGFTGGVKDYLTGMDPETAMQVLGEDFLSKLRKADLGRVKRPEGTATKGDGSQAPPSKRNSPMRLRDLEAELNKAARGG